MVQFQGQRVEYHFWRLLTALGCLG